jgi:outer membrane protein, heavy metal efflux system
LKQAYYRLAYLYAATEILDRNVDVLRKFLKISEARYSVGKAEQQDMLKAQTQISLLEARRIPLEQEKRARESEINSLLGRTAGTPLGRPLDLAPRSKNWRPRPGRTRRCCAATRRQSSARSWR